MRISRSGSGAPCVLTVSGMIDSTETDDLRTELLDTIDSTSGDLVLDASGVDGFVDSALTALTAGRSRAKYLRRRIVVVDREDGLVATALRRTGLRYRFPVYSDLAAAAEGLEADHSAHDRLVFPRTPVADQAPVGPAATRNSPPSPRQPEGPVEAKPALREA